MSGKPQDDYRSEWMMSSDTHLHTSEWIGVAFFYIISFGKKSIKEIQKPNNLKRNIRVGYLIKVILFFVLVGIGVFSII
jgi:hypothetical protein